MPAVRNGESGTYYSIGCVVYDVLPVGEWRVRPAWSTFCPYLSVYVSDATAVASLIITMRHDELETVMILAMILVMVVLAAPSPAPGNSHPMSVPERANKPRANKTAKVCSVWGLAGWLGSVSSCSHSGSKAILRYGANS